MATDIPQAKEPCAACKRRSGRQPRGYVAWHEWAERKSQTHDTFQCQVCGRWSIWKKKAAAC